MLDRHDEYLKKTRERAAQAERLVGELEHSNRILRRASTRSSSERADELEDALKKDPELSFSRFLDNAYSILPGCAPDMFALVVLFSCAIAAHFVEKGAIPG